MPSIVTPSLVASSKDEDSKLPKEIMIRVVSTTSVSSLEDQNSSGLVADDGSDGYDSGTGDSNAQVQSQAGAMENDDDDDHYHHFHHHHRLPLTSPSSAKQRELPSQEQEKQRQSSPTRLYNEAKGSVLLRLCPATAGILILSLLCSPRRQHVQYNDYNHYRLIRSLKIIGSAFLACLMYISLLREQKQQQQQKERLRQNELVQEQQKQEQEQEQQHNAPRKWTNSLSRLRKVRLLIIFILGWQMLVEILLGNVFTKKHRGAHWCDEIQQSEKLNYFYSTVGSYLAIGDSEHGKTINSEHDVENSNEEFDQQRGMLQMSTGDFATKKSDDNGNENIPAEAYYDFFLLEGIQRMRPDYNFISYIRTDFSGLVGGYLFDTSSPNEEISALQDSSTNIKDSSTNDSGSHDINNHIENTKKRGTVAASGAAAMSRQRQQHNGLEKLMTRTGNFLSRLPVMTYKLFKNFYHWIRHFFFRFGKGSNRGSATSSKAGTSSTATGTTPAALSDKPTASTIQSSDLPTGYNNHKNNLKQYRRNQHPCILPYCGPIAGVGT